MCDSLLFYIYFPRQYFDKDPSSLRNFLQDVNIRSRRYLERTFDIVNKDSLYSFTFTGFAAGGWTRNVRKKEVQFFPSSEKVFVSLANTVISNSFINYIRNQINRLQKDEKRWYIKKKSFFSQDIFLCTCTKNYLRVEIFFRHERKSWYYYNNVWIVNFSTNWA